MEKLKTANKLLRTGRIEDAINAYKEALNENPKIKEIINSNIKICERRLKSSKQENTLPQHSEFKFSGFGTIEHYPLVSIIIVSYDSHKDLPELFLSIKKQTYSNIEVIVIENGKKCSSHICAEHLTNYKYKKKDNVGFAEANNIGYDISNGELLALINPDTRLEESCIQELVDAIRLDESAAISVPKINFFEKFIRITLAGSSKFSITTKEIRNRINYKKIFIRDGYLSGEDLVCDTNKKISLDIPHEINGKIVIRVKKTQEQTTIKAKTGHHEQVFTLESGEHEIYINLDKKTYSSAAYLVNNAGSGFRDDGTPYDRGYAEYDDGQYLSKTYLSAFCGCAALIRRSAILDRSIFPKTIFAYHEDSELSQHITKLGYKILYAPEARVYHKHSESTDEKSTTWNVLVSRSRAIYELIKENNSNGILDFNYNYPENLDKELKKRLESLDKEIRLSGRISSLTKKKRKTACIYNSYFSSLGGGEKHSLSFVPLLNEEYEVYLTSETDFSIEYLSSYFNIDLKKCKKIISNKIDSHFSSKFDLFINSTFKSNLVSKAEKNFYLVSFPHKEINADVLNCYTFLHNSKFTESWAKKYWGPHKSKVIFPTLSSEAEEICEAKKEKIILSVGRFNYEGHCKNHHHVIEAFKVCIEKKLITADWELVIIGSCDKTSESSIQYFNKIKNLADTPLIKIISNAEYSTLKNYYKKSAIYVHAAGLGKPEGMPELHEHFGITPHEAMLSGCYPVVYEIGGPSEQVDGLSNSAKFKNKKELIDAMAFATLKSLSSGEIKKTIRQHAQKAKKENLETAKKILSTIHQ